MRIILSYWFGDVSFDLTTNAPSDPAAGGPSGVSAALFALVRPARISLDTGLPGVGPVSIAGAGSILDTIGHDPLSHLE